MDVRAILRAWDLDLGQIREQMYNAAKPRERERWHALWLFGYGWSQAEIAEALGREAHTIRVWLEAYRTRGPAGFAFEAAGGSPPSWTKQSKPR
jgi:transposase